MVILVFFMVISVNRRLFRYFGSYSGISVIPVILVNRRTVLRPLFVCPGKLTSIDASLKKKAPFSGIQTSRRCIPQSAIFSFFNPLLVKWI